MKKEKEGKDKKFFRGPGVKYQLSCGAVIYHRDKGIPFYLLLKYPTYWGFVKGMVEPGETEEQTINRESAEEAGLYDLKIMPRFREVQHYFYKFENELIRKDAVYFIAKTESWKVKISHEHETYRWCSYEDALQLMKLRANRELLTKAHMFIIEYYRQHDMF